jgi:glycosyltransferase involved in cell wall biosynthesis
LLRRRAGILAATGEPTAEREVWQELAKAGDKEAPRRARILTGRLTETDPSWLPRIDGPSERLEPLDRRRILHIAKSSVPERWSGFTIRTLQNMRAQRDAGLEPILVTEIGWPRLAGVSDVTPVVVHDGFEHHRLDRGAGYDLAGTPNDVRLRDTAEAMTAVVGAVRPAILHAHSGYRGGDQALVALALRERFGIPVVYEVRGLFEGVWAEDPVMAERSELYARRLAQETRIMLAADGVVAISAVLADELVSRGIPRQKITIVPNGIDTDALGTPGRDPALRASLGFGDRFVVGYLGNLDHWREGIGVLIDAVAELRERGRDDIAILVVGDGQRRAEYEAHAGRLGLADRTRFTGRVPYETVGEYYAQMDLFVNPRLDERASRYITPLKPYEAMAIGLPVLVSDLPALREIVDAPRRGLVAAPGDASDLASAIARLADDPELRRRLGDAGQAWVRSERTWASNGPRYLAAYEALIGPIETGD